MKQSLSVGQVSLSESEGSIFKKAILCRTGLWKGMHGEVDVDRPMLDRVALWVNTNFASVVNEHSYPPIQIEHRREASETQGRVDISQEKLEVVEASKLNPQWDGFALLGPLRVDDEAGKENVKTGKFSKLSMSFDDETGELYEVSFVAVEAARGSQVLKQGENMDKELKEAKGKITSLSAKVKTMTGVQKSASLALVTLNKGIGERVKNLSAGIESIIKLSQKAEVQSKFKAFIREGKLTKAEYDKLDFEALSSMADSALTVVLSSYESRMPSVDMNQYGSVNAVKADQVNLSDDEYKKALAAQEKGETYTLSAEENPGAKKEEGKEEENLGAEKGDSDEPYDLSEVVEKVKALKDEIDELKKLAKLAQDENEKMDKEEDE